MEMNRYCQTLLSFVDPFKLVVQHNIWVDRNMTECQILMYVLLKAVLVFNLSLKYVITYFL